MATNNWVGATKGTSNFWDNAANWSKSVPANSSDVTIAAPGTYSVVITAADRPYRIPPASAAWACLAHHARFQPVWRCGCSA